MIFQAIEFAAAAHRGQYRKGTRLPYIMHPLNAARCLLEAGCEDELVAAAILHDVLEDTETTIEELYAAFGPRVAELVIAVSEPKELVKWEDCKTHTLDALQTSSLDVLYVAIADKLDNIRSIRSSVGEHGETTWKCFRRGRDQQRWYYETLRRIFTERLTSPPGSALAADFAALVTDVFGPAEPPESE